MIIRKEIEKNINELLLVYACDPKYKVHYELSNPSGKSNSELTEYINVELTKIVTFLKKEIETCNGLFLSEIKSLLNSNSQGYDYFLNTISELVDYASGADIPLVLFPQRNCLEEYIETKFISLRNSSASFIRFVWDRNNNLDKEGIPFEYQKVNFMAHELGHSEDTPIDDKKWKTENGDYKYSREYNAWKNAEKILKQLNIENKFFFKQANSCLRRYAVYYQVKPILLSVL